MDRIPLCQQAPGKTEVDLLIPLEPTDLNATYTRSYGWSAFVRRRETCHEGRDRMDVWIAKLGSKDDDVSTIVEAIARGERPPQVEATPRWTVSYPSREWAVPILENATWDGVQRALGDPSEQGGNALSLVGVVGVTQNPQRQPLAAARAALFATPQAPGSQPVGLPVTYVAVASSLWAEATVLVFAPVAGDTKLANASETNSADGPSSK
jgi:hypothetical protein